MMTSTISFK